MKSSWPVYFDPWKSTLSAGAPATVVRVSPPSVPGTVTRPLRRTGSQPASMVERGTDRPRSATTNSGLTPLVLLRLASASTGVATVVVAALPCAQPFGTLTEKTPSDDVTGPSAPVTFRPRIRRPITAITASAPPPIRSHTGQLIPDARDWAGAGNGASTVGWVGAGAEVVIAGLGVGTAVVAGSTGKAETLLSAPTRRVWHFGHTDSPFAYHVQQVRQTARLKTDPG